MKRHLLIKSGRNNRYQACDAPARDTSFGLCAMLALWLVFAVPVSAAQESATDAIPVPAGTEQRLPGKFVWAELVTYDTALSETFYGQLFDWQFEDDDGYRVAWHGEEPIGGLVLRPRKNPDAKSRWIAYMSVENMPEAKASLAAAGAQLLADSRHVAGLGELAVYADKEGALFGLIDSAGSDPQDYLADTGDWIWLQLFSHDAQQASDFYKKIGGYQQFDNPQSPGSFLLVREGYARAAISTLAPQYKAATPAWVPFVRVSSIEDTLERAQALGGKILVAPRADLYDNRVAMIEAPDGSAVGILVWNADAVEVSR